MLNISHGEGESLGTRLHISHVIYSNLTNTAWALISIIVKISEMDIQVDTTGDVVTAHWKVSTLFCSQFQYGLPYNGRCSVTPPHSYEECICHAHHIPEGGVAARVLDEAHSPTKASLKQYSLL